MLFIVIFNLVFKAVMFLLNCKGDKENNFFLHYEFATNEIDLMNGPFFNLFQF
jgi:hypothetical protein